jgi:hypothetical protein
MNPNQIQKDIKKALNFFRAGGDKWTRTTDSRIFSPMLYQLSYITVHYGDANVGI